MDIHTPAGNRVFTHGHCVLFKGIPEPKRVYLADRGYAVAYGFFTCRHRHNSSLELEGILVICDMDGLYRYMGDIWAIFQKRIARHIYSQRSVLYPYIGDSSTSRWISVFPFQNGKAVWNIRALVTP